MGDPVATEIHPVQIPTSGYGYGRTRSGELSSKVTLAAYEVYCEVYSPQPALVDLEGRNCRGGFSTGELISFLYARSFPREQWRMRVDEATRGMKHL